MARRLASCPLACPPMPSATTNKPNCSAFELSVRSPWAAKRLSSFGLCWRLMPGLERVPTTRLILRPVNCSTGGPGNAGAVLTSSPVYGSVLSNSTCPFLNWLGDISLVGWSYIEAAGTSPGAGGDCIGAGGGDDGERAALPCNPASAGESGTRQFEQNLSIGSTG